jgi:hypothetical protein
MKLICINNKDFYIEGSLTIGKEYKVEKEDPCALNPTGDFNNYIFVKSDLEKYLYFNKNRFVTIKEYRKLKLQKINESNL